MIKEYRKKPVIIKAVQWNGENIGEIMEFCGESVCISQLVYDINAKPINNLEIKTLEGTMMADLGDFIIQGVKGEFYPCKPDIFEKTYELVN